MARVSAQELGKWAAAARARWNVPGIAVGALFDGEVMSTGVGIRELGRGEPVRPDTVFRLASVTKPFTATLAMTLAQDGELALDEPPPGTRVEATVRQLLSHQGGLASEWPRPLDNSDLLAVAQAEPERLPVGAGELFSYSNCGFWFVAAGIAHVLGTSFEDAMRVRVIEPLGLQATSFEAGETAAVGHEQLEPGADEHAPVAMMYPRARSASGGLWSSVPDLLRFAQHHLGDSGPLTPPSIAEMQRPLSSGPGFQYGLGWFLRRRRGRDAVEHQGSVLGFQSVLVLVPEERFAFAALTNSSRGYAAIRDVLREVGLGDDEPATVELPDLGRFAGRYRSQGDIAELAVDDGLLRLERTEVDPFSGGTRRWPSVSARPIGEGEFEIADGEWRSDRFDFPRPGFACIDLRLFQRQ
jgi:CubicO group peptidase (beta-lactamase class C family)